MRSSASSNSSISTRAAGQGALRLIELDPSVEPGRNALPREIENALPLL